MYTTPYNAHLILHTVHFTPYTSHLIIHTIYFTPYRCDIVCVHGTPLASATALREEWESCDAAGAVP